MSKIWWFLCRCSTSTGALWLAVAGGVFAGLGNFVMFVVCIFSAGVFDSIAKRAKVDDGSKPESN